MCIVVYVYSRLQVYVYEFLKLVWCSVLHCVAVWCSVMQCDAVCCSVLQCGAG